MIKHFSIVILLSTIFLSGCVTSGNKSVSNLTEHKLSEQLVKGHTTKLEVKNLYGEPKDIETIGTEERWLYEFKKSTPKATTFMPVVHLFASGHNDEVKRLKIYFDKNEKFIKHVFSTHKDETKFGF